MSESLSEDKKRYLYAKELIKEVGTFVAKMQFSKFNISYKSNERDPVTEIDKKAQDMIYSGIEKIFLEDSFLGEENDLNTTRLDEESLWIVDPIDGTANYMHGLPLWCISIGYYRFGKPIFGLVYAPVMNQLFEAYIGEGSKLNGNNIRVSNIERLSGSCISTGLTDLITKINDSNQKSSDLNSIIVNSFKKTQRLRLLGTAALQICYVAAGFMECFFETYLYPWDIAAAELIVREADGKISRINGDDYSIKFHDIMATNGNIHDEMLQLITEYLPNS